MSAPDCNTHLRTGDSLREDAFPDLSVDAVLCAPPFGLRDWGQEELALDGRWSYGVPPRNESELAWLQHALSHLVAGGSGAERRSLLFVETVGMVSRPRPESVSLQDWGDQILALWEAFTDAPDAFEDTPGVARAVPLVELLDKQTDLSPSWHVRATAEDIHPVALAKHAANCRAQLSREAKSLVATGEPWWPSGGPAHD